MNAVIYARVSIAEQATSGLGIAAQIERCRAYATARGLEARVVSENGISGMLAPEDRPALGPELAEPAGPAGANMLIVAKLDRLGRDVRDVLTLPERAGREGWGLVVLDLDIDTTTAGGKLILIMFAALDVLDAHVATGRQPPTLAGWMSGAEPGRYVPCSRHHWIAVAVDAAGGGQWVDSRNRRPLPLASAPMRMWITGAVAIRATSPTGEPHP